MRFTKLAGRNNLQHDKNSCSSLRNVLLMKPAATLWPVHQHRGPKKTHRCSIAFCNDVANLLWIQQVCYDDSFCLIISSSLSLFSTSTEFYWFWSSLHQKQTVTDLDQDCSDNAKCLNMPNAHKSSFLCLQQDSEFKRSSQSTRSVQQNCGQRLASKVLL